MTIKIQINGKDVELTAEEAKRIHAELNALFGLSSIQIQPYYPQIYPNISPVAPSQPSNPWTWPNIVYGGGTISGGSIQ